ncbi:hypothetical protein GCM10028777_20410 [Angustibacter speluncae]
MTWAVIAVLAVGTALLKTLGPVLAGGRRPPERLERVVDLLAPALLASLVVTSTFTTDGAVVVDGRAAGVAVGLGLLLVRAPLLVALVAGAVTAAALHAWL